MDARARALVEAGFCDVKNHPSWEFLLRRGRGDAAAERRETDPPVGRGKGEGGEMPEEGGEDPSRSGIRGFASRFGIGSDQGSILGVP